MVNPVQIRQIVRPKISTVALVCISKKYPLGLGGTSGEIAFKAVDFDDTGTHVVVGGWCKDSGLCLSSNAQPII
jgi:hypothetical protein